VNRSACDIPPEDWSRCHAAARQAEIDQAIRELYARLDAAVQARGPTCWLSGKCCNFNPYGHRLYVTALEIAWTLKECGALGVERGTSQQTLDGPCSFQVNKLCSVHTVRPLGCRIFFCQSGTQEWQNELYEQFQAEIRRIHETHAIPYHYLEWRAGLLEAAHCRNV